MICTLNGGKKDFLYFNVNYNNNDGNHCKFALFGTTKNNIFKHQEILHGSKHNAKI